MGPPPLLPLLASALLLSFLPPSSCYPLPGFQAANAPSPLPSPPSANFTSLLDIAVSQGEALCRRGWPLTWLTCFGPLPVALNLSHSDLRGESLPATISGLYALTSLDVSSASLGGTLPSELGRLRRLRALDLSQNWGVSGSIPSSLSALLFLQSLNLGATQLGGAFPDWVTKLSDLSVLSLASTLVEGAIPSNVSSLSKLQVLNLGNATLVTGSIPATLCNLSSLSFLRISEALGVAGTIPSSLSSLQNLNYLELSNLPGVTGPLGPSFANWTALATLMVRGTNVSGPLPSSLGAVTNLTYLDLHSNMLTGSLPISIGSLVGLEILNLRGNKLAGSIPGSIFTMQKLRTVQISSNEFVGELPFNASNGLNALTYLDVSSNYLSGNLPMQVLGPSAVMKLDNNFFYGSLSPNLCGSKYFSANGNCLSTPNATSCQVTNRPPSQCQQFCSIGTGNVTSPPCNGYGTCTPSTPLNASTPAFHCADCQPGTVPDSLNQPPNQTCVSTQGPAPAPAPAPGSDSGGGTPASYSPSSSVSTGLAIGLTVGCSVGLALLVGAFVVCLLTRQKDNATVEELAPSPKETHGHGSFRETQGEHQESEHHIEEDYDSLEESMGPTDEESPERSTQHMEDEVPRSASGQ